MGKAKEFFRKTGGWFKRHAPSRRRLIQVYSALLFNCNLKGYVSGKIYQGATKNACVPGLNCYSCPGAVGACPLGALQDSLAQSGNRTPYYIFGILALFGLIFARTICGFLCPVGLGQELLHKIKTPKLKKSKYTRIFSYFKYVLLAVTVIAIPLIYHGIPAFCKYVCPAGTFGGSLGLLSNPNNSDFFEMLDYLFSWKFVLLVLFVVGSIFIYRFFCRFFCPLGAIYGFFNKIALFGVKLDDKKCIDCGLCLQTCQMDIRRVGDHECIQCGACVRICPTKAITWKGSQIFLQPAAIPAAQVSVTEEAKPVNVFLQTPHEAERTEPVPESSVTAEPSAPTAKAETLRPVAVDRVAKRNFRLQFAAWATALVVLTAAIVYYNFLSPDVSANEGVKIYAVGDELSYKDENGEKAYKDYRFTTIYETAGAYGADGEKITRFSTAENRGKVMVINFWYTTCDPCKDELPHFDRVAKEYGQKYGDDLIMLVVHSNNGTSAADVQRMIDSDNPADGAGKESYRDYSMIFTHDSDDINCYNTLGGKSAFPMTVVIDKDYKLSFLKHSKLSAENLKAAIDAAFGG